MENSTKTGHLYLIITLVITLVIPLSLIILSYFGIISGIGEFIVAIAVIASALYIIIGGLWSVIQDKKDLINQAK